MINLDDLLHEALALFSRVDGAVELEQAKARISAGKANSPNC